MWVNTSSTMEAETLPWNDNEWRFPVLFACSGLGMIAIFNSDLGFARDWDLLAAFGLCVVMAAGTVWMGCGPAEPLRRPLLLMACVVTALSTGGFILVNTNEERALSRCSIIINDGFKPRRAFEVLEGLAMYYREHHEYERSIGY